MFMLKTRIKKIMAFCLALITIILFCIPLSKAEDSIWLPPIYQNTNKLIEISNSILAAVNNIPELLKPLTALALGWLSPDTSTTTANLQQTFAQLNDAYLTNTTNTFSMQNQLLNSFFGANASMNYANDLSYSSLWGVLYTPEVRKTNPDGTSPVDPAYNYVKNASGLNIAHVTPGKAPSWTGGAQNIANYQNYYNTIASVQTFNAFILSQSYVNQKNGYQFTKAQWSLIKQASDATQWFAQVASENIGIVLRQILMYDSQIYLTLTQLLQTQQQMLTAQSMTNTLLILGNQFTENQLVAKATGEMPS